MRRYPLPLLAILLIGMWTVTAIAAGQAPAATEKAVFFVAWYDVGKAALEGQPGITSVTSGFQGFREINAVVYDPTQTSVEKMESILKEAGTYRGTDGK